MGDPLLVLAVKGTLNQGNSVLSSRSIGWHPENWRFCHTKSLPFVDVATKI